MADTTILSKQETKWLKEQRVTRLTDNKEVQIYPMGAERYLASVLLGHKKGRYDLRPEIENKNILVIPGYGNSGFLFAQAGAKSVTVYDKDPVTIAWVKAFKKFYHYREYDHSPSVGELLTALTYWYPSLISLPSGKFANLLCWGIYPQQLRRTYLFYMLSLVQQALRLKTTENFELDKAIQFHTGELKHLLSSKEQPVFDTAFVPYLLGVENGIEKGKDIVEFIEHLLTIIPKGHLLVTPSRDLKEFRLLGKSYFVTTGYATIQAIPELKNYLYAEDNAWFRTQGLAIFAPANQLKEHHESVK